MNKEDRSAGIVEKYMKEKDVDKLKEILELSRRKVDELEEAISQIEEEKVVEAYRSGDKAYLEKIVREMDRKGEDSDEDTFRAPNAYTGY
jgi:TFIIF-interacting CTD phosphatase-like protein